MSTLKVDTIKSDTTPTVTISDGLSVSGVTTSTGAKVTGQLEVTTGANSFLTSANVFKGTAGQKGVYLRSALSAAGTPSYSSVDDTNTGIFLPGSDVFGVTTGGSERLRIDSSGRVLTNHTASVGSGKIQAFASQDAIDILSYSTTDTHGGRLTFYRSKNATIGSNTEVADGDSLGRIDWRGYNDDGTTYNQGARIEALVSGSVNSSTDMPSDLVFKTSPDGSSTPTERLRITSAGSVGIGTDNPGGGLTVKVDDSSTNVTATGGIALNLKNKNSTDNTWVSMDFNNSAGGIVGRIGAQFADTSDKTTDLYFCTRKNSGSLTERFRISRDGAFGIAGANYGTSGQVLSSGGSSSAASWADAGGGLFSRAWYDMDTSETTITGSSGETRVGGNSGSNLEVTWTPPSTSTKYVYVCYLHFRFSLGGQWGWQPEFTSNNWTSKTGIGNHPSFGNEYPNDVLRTGLVQVGDFHPNTTNECKLGLFATVWSSHSASITLNGSLQKSRIFLYEVADPQSNFSGI